MSTPDKDGWFQRGRRVKGGQTEWAGVDSDIELKNFNLREEWRERYETRMKLLEAHRTDLMLCLIAGFLMGALCGGVLGWLLS